MSKTANEKPPICLPEHGAMSVGALSDSQAAATAHERGNANDDSGSAPISATPPAPTLAHWTFLAIALMVVGASMSLSIRNHHQVIVPIIDAPLPGSCTFRKVTGIPCPGCGLTRSFISVAHGRVGDAWNYNPAGFLFFAVVAFQIPFRIVQIARIRRHQAPYRFSPFDNWALVSLALILILQWVIRLPGHV